MYNSIRNIINIYQIQKKYKEMIIPDTVQCDICMYDQLCECQMNVEIVLEGR